MTTDELSAQDTLRFLFSVQLDHYLEHESGEGVSVYNALKRAVAAILNHVFDFFKESKNITEEQAFEIFIEVANQKLFQNVINPALMILKTVENQDHLAHVERVVDFLARRNGSLPTAVDSKGGRNDS